MKNNIKTLIKEFNKIKNLGWIKADSSDTGDAGNKLESLLHKERDNFCFPDFMGIELKTKKENAKEKYINLFCSTPYGKDFFEIKRLQEKYGYPDKLLNVCKILNCDVFCKYRTKTNSGYYFSLKLDYETNKLLLYIFDRQMKLVDNYAYWDLEELKQKLIYKLSYLAYIKVKEKNINGHKYYRYTSLNIYKINHYNIFLKLLEQAQIKVQFRIGVFKKGTRIGKIHDRGTCFEIKEEHLEKLFSKIICIDNRLVWNQTD